VVTGISSSSAGTNDFYTAKYAASDGALLWEQRYNGPANGNDRAQAVALDADGNVVVTGYSFGTGSGYDYYTAKYAAADGALLWEKRYNGPANFDDIPRAVAVDTIGNVVVTGNSTVSAGFSESYTAKYAATDGDLLWAKRSTNGASALVVDSGGNVVVTGASAGGNGSSGSYTAKYAAADGGLLWEKRSTNGASLAALDNSGNVVVAGTGYPDHGGSYIATYAAADGTSLWEQTRRQGQWDIPSAIAVSPDGEVVVLRNAQGTSFKDNDWFTVKYAAGDGALLWEKRYDGPANGDDRARAVAADRNGNVIVTGNVATTKYAAADGAMLWKKPGANAVAADDADNVVLAGDYLGGGDLDFLITKYAPGGELLWEQHHGGLANLPDRSKALAVDRDGNVMVTGESYTETDGRHGAIDYLTAKFAAADGSFLWERRYDGMANNHDSPAAIAVDGSGNVVVTGTSYSMSPGRYDAHEDYYTAKYAAADGALIWEHRYDGPATNNDAAVALAVDGSGNVVVTGSSYNRTDTDFYTAKYAAADGALLWENRYDGPAHGNDAAGAVAVDTHGNVVVTGTSKGAGGAFNSDYYTAKYAAVDGTLLWERRYNSSTNGYSVARAVAVDEYGDVVVTGSSDADYYTAKYAAADGTVLWEERQSIPIRRVAHGAALALGSHGMVAVTGFQYASYNFGGVLPDFDYVTVVYRETLPGVAIDRVPDGIRLRFTGTNSRSYEVQRAASITGPWSTLATPIAPLDGAIEYLDAAPLAAAAFYRITTAP
jgi:outer membrane protein assembly factor BamB